MLLKKFLILTINFEEFVHLLEEHFNDENPTPIIINDTTVNLIICGIKTNDDCVYFIILDPHIRDDDKGEKGVYFIKLNKNGYFDFEENPQPTILGQTLCFDEKSWMVFIPNNI
jgi:hypothetical protein